MVTLYDKPPRTNTPLRPVPPSIKKPEYYESGIPRSTYLVEKGGITVSKAAEPEIKTEEQIQKLREACKLARLVLNSAVREAKVNPK